MKLQDVVLAEQIGVLGILRNLSLSDRQHRYTLRKGLEAIGKELKDAYEERDRLIKEIEPDTGSVPATHPKFGELNRKVMDYWASESSEKIEPCIYPEDIENLPMSVAQEDALDTLGLIIQPKPEAAAPKTRAERMHVPPKSGKKK